MFSYEEEKLPDGTNADISTVCIDLSRQGLAEFPTQRIVNAVALLTLSYNQIGLLPSTIDQFKELVTLDISNNGMCHISDELSNLSQLRVLVAKNNALDIDSLPKNLAAMVSLRVLNLGGNRLIEFPNSITEMSQLRQLYLGDNKIREVPRTIQRMSSLEVLSLGGNELDEVPAELGCLSQLSSLNLASNRLQSLPPAMRYLRRLRSLSLHNNNLATLPPEIVMLDLVELSLRGNPLVVRFVEQMAFEPPSLLELAGRAVKSGDVRYVPSDLPVNLSVFLESAKRCVNPKCKGVYFNAHVEHIKFVDFCGKYRLPLLQYLCSPGCTPAAPRRYAGSSGSDSDSDEELAVARQRLRRVLLG